MMDVMVVLALGLAVGGVVGFVLGVEHPKGCLECAYGAEGQYRRGMEDGWADCSKAIRLELDRLIGKTPRCGSGGWDLQADRRRGDGAK